MRQENVMFFTEKEEEFANLLIEIGTKRNVAKVLVFLANTPEATSRAIERGTDLRQPEVSIAMRYLMEHGWITSRESKAESKGRPVKIYELAKPINDIMDSIEKEKKKEANHQLQLIQKLRNYIS
jgi:predicted transcriptional regulator